MYEILLWLMEPSDAPRWAVFCLYAVVGGYIGRSIGLIFCYFLYRK